MAAASNVRRALSNASSITSSPLASTHTQSNRRLMNTASAYALDAQAPIDIQIFDIFDAPSRLGESSKMLRRSSAARTAPVRTERAVNTATPEGQSSRRNYVKPLPAPILYDGPARPPHVMASRLRARNAHSLALAAGKSHEERVASTLPPPQVFEGPSRLRPYGRGTSDGQTVRAVQHV